MKKVVAVKANEDFSLDLKFNDGSVRRFDATPYLDRGVFAELKDFSYFRQVKIAFGPSNGRTSRTLARRLCI